MKRKRNEPGGPVDCELAGLFHRSRRDSNHNKAQPEARVRPDEARPGPRVCPDEVRPGVRMCPNDTSHDVSAMLENKGCERLVRGRHNEGY